ncbi:MAG: M56 family metallopeptidase [Rhodospirillales bacterium]
MAHWVAATLPGPVLNGVLTGTVLAGLVWLTLRLFPRITAAMRYAVWLAALLAIVSLPVLMVRIPGASVQGSAGLEGAAGKALLTLPAPGPAILWLLGVWGSVAALLLLRLAWSYRRVLGLKRRARPLGGRHLRQFEEVLKAYGGSRRVWLCVSREAGVPMAAGLWKPVILIPEALVDSLSDDEFRQVLIHELAHIRRWDDWTNLVQKLAEAVFFFNPAVLWIARRLNLEREIACDDWVVSMTGAARPYAACLARLIDLSACARGPQLAHGAVTRKRQISHRIESLMSRKRRGNPRSSPAGVLAISGALAVLAVLAAHVTPVAVAEPAIDAPPLAAAPIAPPEIAYQTPPRPRPVRQAAPKRAAREVAKREAPSPARHEPLAAPPAAVASYMVVERWTAVASRDAAGALCVLYVGQGLYVGQDSDGRAGRSWVRILWTVPEPSPLPDGRT